MIGRRDEQLTVLAKKGSDDCLRPEDYQADQPALREIPLRIFSAVAN
jgi:hypothetical protein